MDFVFLLRLCRLGLVSAGLGAALAAYVYFRWQYRYWKKRNVRTTDPSFPFGDVSRAFFSKHFGEVFKEIYDRFKGERFNGMWVAHRPFLMVRDPDLIRSILVRDFDHFRDRGLYQDEQADFMSGNLFFERGSKWRCLRTKITPGFTGNRLRNMFRVMASKGARLGEELRRAAEGQEEVLPKEYSVRFTHEVAASCFFGVEVDAVPDPKPRICALGRAIVGPSWSAFIRAGLNFFLPDVAALLKVLSRTPRHVSDFFTALFQEVMEYREANGVEAEDFVQMMLRLKSKGYIEEPDRCADEKSGTTRLLTFTFEDAVAQSFILWIGAFEGSATTIQFALYELSKNQELQERAREEVKGIMAKYESEITFDGVAEMEFLGRILNETLRMYPPLPMINRMCNRRYRIPDSDVVIEEGTSVLIPTLGIHMDPEHFPEPQKFDPERFTEERSSSRHSYAFLPFGAGPRACLGQRFARIQMKVCLANLLVRYRFHLTSSTPETPVMDCKAIVYTVTNGIPLRISPLAD